MLPVKVFDKLFTECLGNLNRFLSCMFQGYGFVHFETEEAAVNAIQKVNGMLLNDKKVFVGRFVPRKEREKELGEKAKKFTNVYVKNFGEELGDDKLKDMFTKFGKITSYKVVSPPHPSLNARISLVLVCLVPAEFQGYHPESLTWKLVLVYLQAPVSLNIMVQG